MWAKTLLGGLLMAMLAAAVHFAPVRERSLLATRAAEGAHLRLMTWNIGYAGGDADSRAHTEDLRAVARAIATADPDAVALQELTGADQLRLLLGYLRGRYRGAVCSAGNTDRIEAVLAKARDARFEDVPSGDKYSASAMFKLKDGGPEVTFVSAHADAFNAARRRSFTGDLIDWARNRPAGAIVFIGGDFNFELNPGKQTNLYSDNMKNDSEAYSYILKYFRDLGRDAGWTTFNDRRIDYIFGQPEVALLRQAEVRSSAAVGHMDHWPLIVEVAL